MAKTITQRTLPGYRNGTVNAECFDDLINILKTKPKIFLWRVTNKDFWREEVGKMFFDAVVGNPPYQSTGSGDNKTFAAPIYHEFIKAAYDENLTKHASLIHPARFLFNAGATPGNFAGNFLQNKHVRVVRYEPDAKEFFPTSEIKGGIAITEFDATKTFEPIGTFIPFDELRSIYEKVVVNNLSFQPLSKIMRGQMTFRLSAKAYEDFPDLRERLPNRTDTALRTNAFEVMPDIFLKDKPDDGRDYLQMLGKVGTDRVYRYVRREYMEDIPEFKTYKVFIPAANSSGALGEVVSTPLVGLPLVGCTQTFITVGAFATRAEAEACIAYIKSKFCRALLGILKVTQHNPPQTWAKVPLQDFTSDSDIDWRGNVDAQLYDKYGLTDAEREFIERHVKEMT